MDIKKYTGYFHDGGFIGMKKKKNNIDLFLHSCEISSDELIDKKILSNANMLKGKLSLIGVKWIKVDNKTDKEIPWKEHDNGEILDLEIGNNIVFLLIEWKDYPPKSRMQNISKIEIEAEKIYWENVPDLSDNFCNEN